MMNFLSLSYPHFKSKATLSDRSFTCSAPKLWNALPLPIRSANTVNDPFHTSICIITIYHNWIVILYHVYYSIFSQIFQMSISIFTIYCNWIVIFRSPFIIEFLFSLKFLCTFAHCMEFAQYKFIIIIIIITNTLYHSV